MISNMNSGHISHLIFISKDINEFIQSYSKNKLIKSIQPVLFMSGSNTLISWAS